MQNPVVQLNEQPHTMTKKIANYMHKNKHNT